jgi:hypothetical protein
LPDSIKRPLSWTLRKRFWDKIAITKFRGNRPADIPLPSDEGRRIETIPMASKFPAIPIENIVVADHVPADEASRAKRSVYEFQVGMYSIYPPMQAGLPSIDEDPENALREAYSDGHRRCFPAPVIPAEYQGDDAPELETLAVASPYACYLETAPEGGYHWDLRHLGDYEIHEHLEPLQVRVVFDVDPAARRLRTRHIETALGVCAPNDRDWPLAKKIALCALSTHLSLVRHFNWVHLASGAHIAVATRNQLPSDHPLCRLLWPHIFGTQYSNEIVTKGQMSPGGEFDSIFSFTHRGMCKLFADTYEAYDITVIDPERDAARRGLKTGDFDTPSQINLERLFQVFHAHAERYVRAYYATDSAIRNDADVQKWLAQLEQLIPNGIRRMHGDDTTRASVARLVAAFIYLATVQHDILGTGMWNYQMWVNKQPVRVYKDREREPLDVYQRLINANFNLNVSRRKLMDDFSYFGLDPKGIAEFTKFREELRALQRDMEMETFAHWKVYPAMLEANINA